MQCVKCGGDVWDNRPKKLAGGMKPNGPDFACKNKESCGWVQWPPKVGASPVQAPPPSYQQVMAPRLAQSEIASPVAPQAQPAPSGRDVLIQELFWDSFDAVLEGVAKRKLADWAKPETIASLTATMFIQRSKG